jgi:hypothetical protein
LQSGVAGALNWRHELRELLLLLLEQIRPLPLQLHESVEVAGDLSLIRMSRITQRIPQCEACLALLTGDRAALRLKTLMDRSESAHLRVTQANATLCHLPDSLLNPALELLPILGAERWLLTTGAQLRVSMRAQLCLRRRDAHRRRKHCPHRAPEH